MVQCEMCGAETSSPKTAKIEGAELQVCDDCADFGTEIDQGSDEPNTTTKYSTSGSGSSGGTASSSSGGGGSGSSSGGRSRRDMFDDMDEVVADYDERIRQARESAGLSQAELGDQLNEKASFIRKLERGESLPSDDLRKKLERELDIELLEGGGDDGEAEWSGGGGESGMTLGDVVKRKD
jgi:putative transcription factor